jgi:hypothetical protein
MKINVIPHRKAMSSLETGKEEGRAEGRLHRNPRKHLGIEYGSPFCVDGEQVSMMSASSNVLSTNKQFITSCAETQ